MKLKSEFVTQDIGGTLFVIPVGAEQFKGIVRSNPTAAFIIQKLAAGTTKEEIIDEMCAVYEADRAEITADVEELLDQLRTIGALE